MQDRAPGRGKSRNPLPELPIRSQFHVRLEPPVLRHRQAEDFLRIGKALVGGFRVLDADGVGPCASECKRQGVRADDADRGVQRPKRNRSIVAVGDEDERLDHIVGVGDAKFPGQPHQCPDHALCRMPPAVS